MAHSFKEYENDVVGKWNRSSWKYTASGTSYVFAGGAAQYLDATIKGTSAGCGGLEIARFSGLNVVLSGLVTTESYIVTIQYI